MPSTIRKILLVTLPLLVGCGFIGFEAESSDAGRDAGSNLLDATPGPDLDAGEPDDAALDVELLPIDADSLDAELDAALDAALDAEVEAAVATQVTDYCMSIPALPDAPVIDGQLDGRLNLVPVPFLGWAGSSPMAPSDTTAVLAAAFRPDGLYVYVRVTDPNRLPPLDTTYIWEGDGVELYVDDDGAYAAGPQYDNPGSIQIITVAPSDATTPVARATRFRDTMDLGAWTSPRFSAFPTADGYVLEAFVTADGIDRSDWSLQSGGSVGFNISINVSGSDDQVGTDAGLQGYRLGQYFLYINGGPCSGRPYCSSMAFCNPVLVD